MGSPEKQLRKFFYGRNVEKHYREYYLGDRSPLPVRIYTSGKHNGSEVSLVLKCEFECGYGLHFRRLDYNIKGQNGNIKLNSINFLPSLKELIESV